MQGFTFTVSESAKLKLKSVLKDGQSLLISIEPGGCNGFSYKYNITQSAPHDATSVCTTPSVLVDTSAIQLISGAILQYESDDIGASFFSISNPNATSQCGCGNSFSTFS